VTRAPLDPPDEMIGRVRLERHHLRVEPGIVVPLIVLVPPHRDGAKAPLVIGLAQEGKQALLNKRADQIAALLTRGIAVALPDLRGIGETSPGPGRDRRAPVTSVSATGLMTGNTLLGARLRDLRAIHRYLKRHPALDEKRIALWGDSFIDPYPEDFNGRVPHGIDGRPEPCEPLGGLLAMLAALYEDDIRAVYVHGGLSSWTTALADPFCHLPHDVVVPGALTAGDVCDLAAALAPRPLRIAGMVDGGNRRLTRLPTEKAYAPTRAAYRAAGAEMSLILEPAAPSAGDLARWLLANLGPKEK
jgi:hypothetical protein